MAPTRPTKAEAQLVTTRPTKANTQLVKTQLAKTQSLCPVCLKRVEAQYVQRDGRVYMEKACPQHGAFCTLVWEEGPDFVNWDSGNTQSPPLAAPVPIKNGCPHDCGPCQSHRQAACCVLLEITKRCNQRCPYCFASAETESPTDDWSLAEAEEVLDFLKTQCKQNPFNIQLSGGEPTLHPQLPAMIGLCRQKGFGYVQINTNGRRLAEEEGYAKTLRRAGLHTVFLQFDGTRDDIYRALRGQALLATKEKAIKNSLAAGLGVVLVVTVVPGVNEENLGEILAYATKYLPRVRGVHLQPVSYFGRFPAPPGDAERITLPGLMGRLAAQTGGAVGQNTLVPLESGHGRCSFHGNFLALGGKLQALSQKQPPGSDHNIEKARAYLARKWGLAKAEAHRESVAGSARESAPPAYDAEEWSGFLKTLKKRSLSVTAMAFQDVWNVDLQRLQRCRLQVATRQKRLIPFCAWQLTSQTGRRLYPDIDGIK